MQCHRVFAREHQHVFFARATQPDLAARAGQGFECRADVVLNALFAWALVAFRQQYGKCGLADFRSALRGKRVTPCAAAANGGVDTHHMLYLADQQARLLGSAFGLRQRRARRQLQVDLGLRIVVGRDEAGGQQRDQGHRTKKENGGSHHGLEAVGQTPASSPQIQRHPAWVFVRVHDGFEHIGGHHRCQHPRHQQRRHHRQRRGPAELLEEFSCHTTHEGGRQKHRYQREGGGNHRQANFVGRFHRSLVRRLAHTQVAHDVLHLHNRIVHQNADHQRQRQQRNHVDAEAQQIHTHKCRNDGQR